jgi:hypothetical protein
MTNKPPIFIVGGSHCGTTLLLRILGNHPNIYGVRNESELFYRSTKTVRKWVARFDDETKKAGKDRWLEKTPRHVRKLVRIANTFVGAKFIALIRDGRDVTASLKERGYPEYLDRWAWDALDVEKICNRGDVLVIKYEDLVHDTEDTIRKCLNHVDEEYVDSIMEYRETSFAWSGFNDAALAVCGEVNRPDSVTNSAELTKLRVWQVDQPIYTSKIGRWKTDLDIEELEHLKKAATYHLIEFGYVSDAKWLSLHLEEMACGVP